MRELHRHPVDHVDIGANDGGFVTAVRRFSSLSGSVPPIPATPPTWRRSCAPYFTGIRKQLECPLVPHCGLPRHYREEPEPGEDIGATLMIPGPVFADSKSSQLIQADTIYFLA